MDESRLLLVEGDDEKHVFYAILEHRSFRPEFPILELKSDNQLLREIPRRLRPGGSVERLGIVVDADTDLASRWGELKRIFDKIHYRDIPEDPSPEGTILFADDLPTVGVWIMPDNVLRGVLEDFLIPMIPNGDVLWMEAQKHLAEVVKVVEPRFKPQHYNKALVHTYLAWQDEPGLPMGRAVTRRFFQPDSPYADAFVAWLTRLFA